MIGKSVSSASNNDPERVANNCNYTSIAHGCNGFNSQYKHGSEYIHCGNVYKAKCTYQLWHVPGE